MTIIIVTLFTWKFISLCAHFPPQETPKQKQRKGFSLRDSTYSAHIWHLFPYPTYAKTFPRIVRRLELWRDALKLHRSSETGRKRKTDNECECAETQSCSMAITTHCLAQLTVWEKRSQRVLFLQTKDKRQTWCTRAPLPTQPTL